jgi:hypothetical protein
VSQDRGSVSLFYEYGIERLGFHAVRRWSSIVEQPLAFDKGIFYMELTTVIFISVAE